MSIGPIQLGETRASVRSLLGPHYETFEKTAGARKTDAYDELGVHIYYDGEDLVECVESFGPAEVDFRGVDLIDRDSAEVRQELDQLGVKGTPTDNGLNYNDHGFVLSLDGKCIDGVAVYKKGYYD